METPNWWPQWLKSLDEISDGKTAKTCCGLMITKAMATNQRGHGVRFIP